MRIVTLTQNLSYIMVIDFNFQNIVEVSELIFLSYMNWLARHFPCSNDMLGEPSGLFGVLMNSSMGLRGISKLGATLQQRLFRRL